jgi:enhancing lycopene biosynthesis protein 2
VNQHHVLNHLTGEEMKESRNVRVESARIARGDVKNISEVSISDIDALVMPGGFGTAKNITQWAFEGPDGAIVAEVKDFIVDLVKAKKPIAALCMSPTTIAKALQGSIFKPTLSVGSKTEASPYEIEAISQGIESTGASIEMKTVKEISVDTDHKIVCAPCYMMEANILEVRSNIKQAIDEMIAMM